MPRILWHSNGPFVQSGYGQQTATFTPRIRDMGHHVAISAYWGLQGAVLGWNGMTMYPSDDDWGNRLLPMWADQERADLVITLMDVWVLKPDKLRGVRNLACWCPVDHEPAPPKVTEFFEKSGARPIAMSQFGERMLTEAGLDPLYVPHGIDTNAFRPRPDERAATRGLMGVPEDAFVVGMVANNQGNSPARKAFPEVMQAFRMLLNDLPDARLYLHSDMTGRKHGVGIGRLMERCGIPEENVHATRPEVLELAGMGSAQMACLYSGFDVLANPSYGEGFGVPIVEAQACGTPVIVTDGTAMRELCGAGWLVQGEPWYNSPQGSFYDRPDPASIYRAMLKAYQAREDRRIREKAREFALQYDADRVAEVYWRPVLESLLAEKPALKVAA